MSADPQPNVVPCYPVTVRAIILLFASALVLMCPPRSFGGSELDVGGIAFTNLVADPARPYVYGLESGVGTGTGAVLRVNVNSEMIEGVLAVGPRPTSMALDSSGDYLYIIDFATNSIVKIDLSSFSSTETNYFQPPPNSSFGWHYDIAVGQSDIVYFADAQWKPILHCFDFAAGTELYSQDVGGVGGLTITKDGSTMYHWRQYGWSAGSINTWITKSDIQQTNLISGETTAPIPYRDPLDAPIMLNSDETLVFYKIKCYAVTNFTSEIATYPESVYAISPDGRYAFAPGQALEGDTGQPFYELPTTTTVMCVSGDTNKLILYDGNAQKLIFIPLGEMILVPGVATHPQPTVGKIVVPPVQNLIWSNAYAALRYRVFYGSDPAAISNATEGSALQIATTTNSWVDVSSLTAAGVTNYWRVDSVGVEDERTGTVWHFLTSPFYLGPTNYFTNVISGCDTGPLQHQVEIGGWTNTWVVEKDFSWAQLAPTSGIGPDTVTVSLITAGLPPGLYSNQLRFLSSDFELELPLVLEVQTNSWSLVNTIGPMDYAWITNFTMELSSDEQAKAIEADGLGNMLVAGEYAGQSNDVLLLKYDTDGQILWTNIYNGEADGDDIFRDMAVDGEGNTYVVAKSFGTNLNYDIVVLKFSPDGVLLWETHYDGNGHGDDNPAACAVDGSNDIYIVATSFGVGLGGDDFLTLKLNHNGEFQWESRHSGTGDSKGNEARGLVVDAQGRCVVSGYAFNHNAPHQWILNMFEGVSGTSIWSQAVTFDGADFLRLDNQTNLVVVTGKRVRKFNLTTGNATWDTTASFPPYTFSLAPADLLIDSQNSVYVPGDWCSASKCHFGCLKLDAGGTQKWFFVREINNVTINERMDASSMDRYDRIYLSGENRTDRLSPYGQTIGTVVSGPEQKMAMVSDSSGNVFLAGWSQFCDHGDDILLLKITPGATNDFDGDGLPNEWELKHFGNTYTAESGSDDDGDGFTTGEEYVTDTDPTNFNSRPGPFLIQMNESDVTVAFEESSTSRIYTIQCRTNLLNNSGWEPLGPVTIGTGSNLVIGVSNGLPQNFYRNVISLP